MTDTTMLKNDLAFVREIAEEGRMLPLQGGRYLILWGILSFIGLSCTALVVTRIWPAPWYMAFLVWIPTTIIGIVMSKRFAAQQAADDGARTLTSKVESRVWTMSGVFIGAFVWSMALYDVWQGAGLREQGIEVRAIYGVISPVIFGLYAIALATTAEAGRATYLWKYVWLSFVLVFATMIFLFTSTQFLITLVGIVAVIILPGVDMLRREKG